MASLLLSPEHAHGGDHRLKGAIRGRPTDAAFPLGVSEVPDVIWQVGFG